MRDSLMVFGALTISTLLAALLALSLAVVLFDQDQQETKTCTKIDRIEEHSAGMYTYEIYARTEGVENY